MNGCFCQLPDLENLIKHKILSWDMTRMFYLLGGLQNHVKEGKMTAANIHDTSFGRGANSAMAKPCAFAFNMCPALK